jgi:hypothetical protein
MSRPKKIQVPDIVTTDSPRITVKEFNETPTRKNKYRILKNSNKFFFPQYFKNNEWLYFWIQDDIVWNRRNIQKNYKIECNSLESAEDYINQHNTKLPINIAKLDADVVKEIEL